MPDAFSYTNGTETRTFKSRMELYDYLVERGEVVIEGDDAPKFSAHVNRKNDGKDAKFAAARAKLDSHGVN